MQGGDRSLDPALSGSYRATSPVPNFCPLTHAGPKRTLANIAMVPRMNLRPGHSKDAVAIGDVWFDSWMSTKPTNPIVTNADLVKRAYNELAGRWEVTIVEADHKVIGFLAVAPAELSAVRSHETDRRR